MRYTDEQRAEAVELYQQVGAAAAARQLGMTARSIVGWANKAGVSQVRAEKTQAAREQLARDVAVRREQLRDLILEKALLAAGLIGDGSARDGKDWATVVGILVDKFRLEMGESTDRREIHGFSEADRELQRMAAEFARAAEAGAAS